MIEQFKRKAWKTIFSFIVVGALVLTFSTVFFSAKSTKSTVLGESGNLMTIDDGEAPKDNDNANSWDRDVIIDNDDEAWEAPIKWEEADTAPLGYSGTPLGLSFETLAGGVPIGDFSGLKLLAGITGVYEVNLVVSNIVFEEPIVVSAGTTLTLTGTSNLNLDNTFTGGRHFIVEGKLILGNGVVLNGADPSSPGTPYAGGVDVEVSGMFTMNGGAIVNCAAVEGGAIYAKTGSTLTFASGSIMNCTATEGGGISTKGTFTFTNGLIENCAAVQAGGGIKIESATKVSILTGIIRGCTAHSGGGIYIKNSNESIVFEFGGNALISECRAVRDPAAATENYPGGGGVYLEQGTFRMLGNSKISNCVSEKHGGGIYSGPISIVEIGPTGSPLIDHCIASEEPRFGADVIKNGGNGGGVHSSGVVLLYGGSIENSHASNNGGGVYMHGSGRNNSSLLVMDGGMIEQCTANNGGGVFLYEENTNFTMYNGNISNCFAVYLGGGVSVHKGTMTMQAGSPVIEDCGVYRTNVAWWAANGGGIHVQNGGQFTMNSGTIQRCTATVTSGTNRTHGSGGGIFVDENSFAELNKGSIIDCTASFHGGGVFTKKYSNLTTTSSFYFSGNTAAFYRIPADGTDAYSCAVSGSISLDYDAKLLGRNSPLNNYDINHLSYTITYVGNGGTDGSTVEHPIVMEYSPFENYSDIAPGNGNHELTYTVLPNDRSLNGLFEFTKSGSTFGMWAKDNVYVPSSAYFVEYPVGTTTLVSAGMLLLTTKMPEIRLNALWQKQLKVEKLVEGDYADMTKSFEITVTVRDAWWRDLPSGGLHVFHLKNGEFSTITIYDDAVVTVVEDTSSSYGYTVEYNDGITTTSSYQKALAAATEYAELSSIPVTVKNTRMYVVPTGISSENDGARAIIMGLLIIIAGWIVVYICIYRCRKRRKRQL